MSMTDDNITPFPKLETDKIIYVCSCRCQSFRVLSSGKIECCNCETIQNESVGEWVKQLPKIPDEITATDAGTVKATALGSAEFAKLSVLREIDRWSKSNDLVFICAYHDNGTGKHWFNINSEHEKEWIIRKLENLLELTRSTKVTE
jgi:hypothetical protein